MDDLNDFSLSKDTSLTVLPISKNMSLPIIQSNIITLDDEEQEEYIERGTEPDGSDTLLIVGNGTNERKLSIPEYTQVIAEEYKNSGDINAVGNLWDRIKRRTEAYSNLPVPVATYSKIVTSGFSDLVVSYTEEISGKSKSAENRRNLEYENYFSDEEGVVSSDTLKKILEVVDNVSKGLGEYRDGNLLPDEATELSRTSDPNILLLEMRSTDVYRNLIELYTQVRADNIIKSAIEEHIKRVHYNEKSKADQDRLISSSITELIDSNLAYKELHDRGIDFYSNPEEAIESIKKFYSGIKTLRHIVGGDKFYCSTCDKLVKGGDWYVIRVFDTNSLSNDSKYKVIANPQTCPCCKSVYLLAPYVRANIRDYVVRDEESVKIFDSVTVTPSFTLPNIVLTTLASNLYFETEVDFCNFKHIPYFDKAELEAGESRLDTSRYDSLIEDYITFYDSAKLKDREVDNLLNSVVRTEDSDVSSYMNKINEKHLNITKALSSEEAKAMIELHRRYPKLDLYSFNTLSDLYEELDKLPQKLQRYEKNLTSNITKKHIDLKSATEPKKIKKLEDDIAYNEKLLNDSVGLLGLVNKVDRGVHQSMLNIKDSIKFRPLSQSLVEIRKNVKLIAELCGADYNLLSIYAKNSLMRELNDGISSGLIGGDSVSFADDLFKQAVKPLYISVDDKDYMYDKLKDYYEEKTNTTVTMKIDDLISSIENLEDKSFMSDMIVPYSFIQIDKSLSKEDSSIRSNDWVDLVTDLMIVNDLSEDYSKTCDIDKILTVGALIEELNAIKGVKIKDIVASVVDKSDKLSMSMALAFEGTKKTWRHIFSKDNCIRFEDADKLYKSIKSRQYTSIFNRGGSVNADSIIAAIAFEDLGKSKDVVSLKYLNDILDMCKDDRKKLVEEKVNFTRQKILDFTFSNDSAESARIKLSKVFNMIGIPTDIKQIDLSFRKDIEDSYILALPHPTIDYKDIYNILSQIREFGNSNIKIPESMGSSFDVSKIKRIESLDELDIIEKKLNMLKKLYVDGFNYLGSIFSKNKGKSQEEINLILKPNAEVVMNKIKDTIIENKLDNIYYINTKDTFYTFREDKEYFYTKGLALMYTAMANDKLNPRLLDKVIRYSSIGLTLPSSVVPADIVIKVNKSKSGGASVEEFVDYVIDSPTSGSALIDFIKNRYYGDVKVSLARLTSDGVLIADSVTGELPFPEVDSDIYLKSLEIVPSSDKKEVMKLIYNTSGFFDLFSTRPDMFRDIEMSDIEKYIGGNSNNDSSEYLEEFNKYMEEYTKDDIPDRKSLAKFARFRSKLKQEQASGDGLSDSIENLVMQFREILGL